ncbi:hypothetical protein CF326_g8648 [Tilletia indica]|nr:hypothetical protein CF326_g8648 [Tilletia indica]
MQHWPFKVIRGRLAHALATVELSLSPDWTRLPAPALLTLPWLWPWQPRDSRSYKRSSATPGSLGPTSFRTHGFSKPNEKQQIGGYYPMRTVGAELNKRNAHRPAQYSFEEVCGALRRNDDTFEADLNRLNTSLTQKELKQAQRDTGVMDRPLLAFSPTFSHPFFFPSDMFHLFGINLPQLLWNVFTKPAPDDPLQLTEAQQQLFGELVEEAASDLPATFSSAPPRNPHKFSRTFYKMHEWSSVTYHYLLPFLFSIGAPVKVVAMIGHLVAGVRMAISDTGCFFDQLAVMQKHFYAFVRLWEELFVRDDVLLLSRASISVHYLLHVPQCAVAYGSMRVTSQARCEREIGLAKRSMRTFKSAFVNASNNAVRREHLRLLNFVLREEEGGDAEIEEARYSLRVRIATTHAEFAPSQEEQEKRLVRRLVQDGKVPDPPPQILHRGKVVTPSGDSIRGERTESSSARKACHFAYKAEDGEVEYAKALHFICFDDGTIDASEATLETDNAYALCFPLSKTQRAHQIIRGNDWSNDLILVPVTSIVELVGTFHLGGHIYILRRLSWLDDE